VDIYPAANPMGIGAIERGIPQFDLDMNRIFPGNNSASPFETMAAHLVADVTGADVAFDIHASNIFLRELPQIRINEISADERKRDREAGIDHRIGDQVARNVPQACQQKDSNVKLRKGSKGHLVIFFKMVDKEDEQDENKIKQLPVLRYYYVYSLNDVDGLELKRSVDTYDHNPEEAENKMNDALSDYFYRDGISVRMTKSDGCYYTPAEHSITIPESRYFKHYNRYLSSLAHEVIHSTAAKMNRAISFNRENPDYAFEELVAEFGASLLLARFSVADEQTTNNNAAYICSWMKHIRDMPAHKLISAMTKAQKAVDFILGEEAA